MVEMSMYDSKRCARLTCKHVRRFHQNGKCYAIDCTCIDFAENAAEEVLQQMAKESIGDPVAVILGPNDSLPIICVNCGHVQDDHPVGGNCGHVNDRSGTKCRCPRMRVTFPDTKLPGNWSLDAGEMTMKEDGTIIEHTAVDHPTHYNNHPSGIECIEIVRHMNFNLGNVVKYIWRCDDKGATIEDLEKAAFYLADEIARRKG